MNNLTAFLKKIAIGLLVFSLKWLRFLPLPILHMLGALSGCIAYATHSKACDRAKRNLKQSGMIINKTEFRKTLFSNMLETGKGLLETFAIWFKPQRKVLGYVKKVRGWQAVEAALQAKKGLIFLTPHLGCFEITSLYYGTQHPMAVLYRPPRQTWLQPLIDAGRQRGMVSLAPASSQGVKQLLQALKRGEAIGILPDQAPLQGEGEWAEFFGRPAYTMTLASKLAEKTGAQVFMALGERLSYGRGYNIHIHPIAAGGIDTPDLLNAEIERAIQLCPAQYLWSYPRHKIPHGTRHKLEIWQQNNNS